MSAITEQDPTPRVLSVRTPGSLYLQLEELARRDAISVSAVVRQLVARGVRAEQGLERRG